MKAFSDVDGRASGVFFATQSQFFSRYSPVPFSIYQRKISLYIAQQRQKMEMLDDYYYLMVSGDVVGYNKSVFFYHSFSNMHSDLLHV